MKEDKKAKPGGHVEPLVRPGAVEYNPDFYFSTDTRTSVKAYAIFNVMDKILYNTIRPSPKKAWKSFEDYMPYDRDFSIRKRGFYCRQIEIVLPDGTEA